MKKQFSQKIIIVVYFLFSASQLFAQEKLSNLKFNTALFGDNAKHGGVRDTGLSRDTLCLPFFDDFSNLSAFLDSNNIVCYDTVYNASPSLVYPNNLFWIDSSVYINQTYSYAPPTYGVATFDGLNKFGKPHNEGIDYGIADTLTSKPLFLGGSLNDTVYLSFYYQPAGYGDYPDDKDSLLLDFKSVDGTWKNAWVTTNTSGSVLQDFRIVMIPVTAEEFLYDGFQFRFRNYASINGNNDHWNVDYVFLEENRSFDDTLFRDVSFTSLPSSYLKRYRQMPWNQFKDYQTDELNDETFITIINNYNEIVNTAYSYETTEKYSGDFIASSGSPVSVNFDPFSTLVNVYPTFSIPSTVSGFEEDSLTIQFQYVLDPSGDIHRLNDTLLYEQVFYNYFAYDDGSAEKAYALEGVGAKLALQFHANEPDTLKEVYIHWAFVDGSKSNLFFSLIVWDDIDTSGMSGDESVLYQADFLTPKYVDSINGFYVYQLTDFLGNPTPVVVSGDFYVGWLQTQSDFLNVGFDVHSEASENVFFNVDGTWQQSVLPGAIMIRPQVGGDYSVYQELPQIHEFVDEVKIFPNPVQNSLVVQKNSAESFYEISDYSGREIETGVLENNTVDTRNLIPGFYILKIREKISGKIFFAKFIKS
ncbi:MAG: T9SS type A sorting domain-containing protein [Chitinophagales bacterium]